jgi:hypothetical protein
MGTLGDRVGARSATSDASVTPASGPSDTSPDRSVALSIAAAERKTMTNANAHAPVDRAEEASSIGATAVSATPIGEPTVGFSRTLLLARGDRFAGAVFLTRDDFFARIDLRTRIELLTRIEALLRETFGT